MPAVSTSPFPQQPPTHAPGTAAPSWPDGSSYALLPPAGPAGVDRTRGRANAALGWAIGATVAAVLAVLLAVVALVMVVGGGGYYEPVRGEVVGLADGAALSGDRLEYAVDAAERDWGWVVEDLGCPDTPAVSTSTVVVCTGSVEGDDWTAAVLFEDSSGAFVLAEF